MIWVRVLFGSLRGRVRVRFLAKPRF